MANPLLVRALKNRPKMDGERDRKPHSLASYRKVGLVGPVVAKGFNRPLTRPVYEI